MSSGLKPGDKEAKPAPAPNLQGHFDLELEELSYRLGSLLRDREGRLVTAESCTGGWLGAAVTAVSGSSNWFALGVTTYSNDAKVQVLGVPANLIKQHGAVSQQVVHSMAEGALRLDPEAILAISVSGVAGPGASADRPAGTVCMGWARRGSAVLTETFRFDGERNQVRRASVRAALRQGIRMLKADS